MSLCNIHHSSGLIDESLDFIVTTMRIDESYIDQTPAWLQKEVFPFRNVRPRIDWVFDRIKNGGAQTRNVEDRVFDENPHIFIGSPKESLHDVAAPKLVRQLAELGIVPHSRKLVFKRKGHNGRIFDLKIFWNKQSSRNDSESVAQFIEETSRFFLEWHLKYGWSVKGIEFVSDVRAINLFFERRRKMLPSERVHEVVVSTDEWTGAKRLVAI